MREDKYKTYEYSTGDPISGEWCTVYELDKALKAIKVRHMHDMDRIKCLEEENKRLKEDYAVCTIEYVTTDERFTRVETKADDTKEQADELAVAIDSILTDVLPSMLGL